MSNGLKKWSTFKMWPWLQYFIDSETVGWASLSLHALISLLFLYQNSLNKITTLLNGPNYCFCAEWTLINRKTFPQRSTWLVNIAFKKINRFSTFRTISDLQKHLNRWYRVPTYLLHSISPVINILVWFICYI